MTKLKLLKHHQLAQIVSEQFKQFSQVQAVALGGSVVSDKGEAGSDIDLYVFTTEIIPLEKRQDLVQQLGASKADLNLTFWDLGDEWIDKSSGIEVDIIYWDTKWIEDMLDGVLVKQQSWMGYTTCFWRSIKNAKILFDREGWLTNLKTKTQVVYPEKLRQSIIVKNHAVLRSVIPSYLNQIKKAIQRGDLVSLNHRVAALIASYFDIIFALNRVLHPGEKRLLETALVECEKLPVDMAQDITNILRSAAITNHQVIMDINTLLDHLDDLLKQEGFLV
ncbi:MAG: DUF4037 domain-containing protein [Anaerolineaceae bacterium]|nr:DUF4037 domain-containing protein [Anaerolineaceae bacterium]